MTHGRVAVSRAGDVRLYREAPAAAAAKGRGGKGRGAKAKPPDAGAWELLADSLEALREAGEKLRRNKQRPEQRLASQVHCMSGRLRGGLLRVRALGPVKQCGTQSQLGQQSGLFKFVRQPHRWLLSSAESLGSAAHA